MMWGGTDEKASIETIRAALDQGITLIDTAPAYGFGQSEEIVGKAIKEYGKRDQFQSRAVFVARITWSLLPYSLIAFPTISSDCPKPYAGAVSISVIP